MALSFSKALTKVFGSRNDRLLKRYRRVVEQINAMEPQVSVKTDAELRERTQEIRRLITSGKVRPAEAMPEAFAIIR
jgi:preprotein translocase subunit SecA